ncbi:MAG: CHAT domain-containing tetratricopeptide repeat protein [Myxococcaceae bacterium]|nr:CHAT domain-containing tetratricopeptide repeat protein [Myxococcaceae bacterium]
MSPFAERSSRGAVVPSAAALVVVCGLVLVGCDEAKRLEPGVPLEVKATAAPQTFRLTRGPVTLTVAPSDARARVTLVRGAVRTHLVDRPDLAPHRLAFTDGASVEVEVSWPRYTPATDRFGSAEPRRGSASGAGPTPPGAPAPDAPWPAGPAAASNPEPHRAGSRVRLALETGGAATDAAFDADLVEALSKTQPPTADSLASALEGLLRLAEAPSIDAARTTSARLAGAVVLARTGDPRARAAFEACLDSPVDLTRARAHLGLAHLDQQEDRLADATKHLEAARALAKDTPRLLGQVAWLESEAMAERSEYAKVLAHLPPYLESAKALGDDGLAAMLEAGTGWGWKNQGDRAKAKAHFEAQAELARRADDPRLVGIALHNQGIIFSDFDGDWAAALPFFEQAVAEFRKVGDLRGLAFSLDASGEMESTLERPIAIEHHREASVLRKRLGHVRGEGQTLVSLGSALTRLHRPEEAFEPLRAGIELFHRIGDTNWEAYGWFRLARASLEAKQFPDAVAHARRSLAIAESLRERIASDDRRASYTGSVANTFDTWIAAAMAQAQATGERRWFAEALEAYERSRARSLLEVVLRIDADRPEGGLRSKDEALRATIRELEFDIRRERAKPRSDTLEALETTMATRLAEYEQLVLSMQTSDPRAAQLGAVPLASLDDAEALAGKDTVIVEYAFGRKSSWALVLGGGAAPEAFRLTEPAKVRDLAVALVEQVSARNRDVEGETAAARAARIAEADGAAEKTKVALRDAVVPFAARLTGKKRLAVVADDSLQRVPWGALVPELAVVQVPSLSVVLAQRKRAGAKAAPTSTLTVVADPVFGEDDPRLEGLDAGVPEVRGEATWRRLPFSATEGETLAKLVPAPKRQVLTGYAATREKVVSGGVSGSRLVHFATHGVLDLATPEKSGLVLTRRAPDGRPVEGFLSLADVYALRLSADLVTLSACETALGAAQRGEGLIGLARGFLHAGARAVVASLWKVNDKATAVLMEAFYEGLLVKKLTPAVALANAQRTVAAMERYRAPYFWAGFVLVGDPRE